MIQKKKNKQKKPFHLGHHANCEFEETAAVSDGKRQV